jgi:hypothetical protein
LKVYLYLDEAERIIDASPRRNNYSRKRMAVYLLEKTGKRSKLLCPVCFQPKVMVCASGHWPPRAKFYNRLRYRTRRAWFGLWRGLKVIK